MKKNRFDIDGMVVGVTGGGGHLGRTMTLGLAAEGADVFICGRDEQKLQRVSDEAKRLSLKGNVRYQALDLTDADKTDSFLEYIHKEGGNLSGWINNASTGSPTQLIGDLTMDGVNLLLTSDLSQAMLTTQCVLRKMSSEKRGSIINIASTYGMLSPRPDLFADHPHFHNPPAYGAAKAGLIHFTKYAACHVAKLGIRVNAISPGPFPSEVFQNEPEFVEKLARGLPMGRVGNPDELLGPVMFLLSDASSYVTGHNLVVDGGWTAW